MQARRLTDTMFMAAAKALAAMSPARNDTGSNLLPPVTALREVSIAVARATALQARKEGLTDLAEDEIERGDPRQDVVAEISAVSQDKGAPR